VRVFSSFCRLGPICIGDLELGCQGTNTKLMIRVSNILLTCLKECQWCRNMLIRCAYMLVLFKYKHRYPQNVAFISLGIVYSVSG
jgi:hypothetical protein